MNLGRLVLSMAWMAETIGCCAALLHLGKLPDLLHGPGGVRGPGVGRRCLSELSASSTAKESEMSTSSELVDGKTDLKGQEDTLNTHERFGQSKRKIHKTDHWRSCGNNVGNAATLDDRLPRCTRIWTRWRSERALATVIANHKAAGRDKVFDGTAWVLRSRERTVLGLRPSPSPPGTRLLTPKSFSSTKHPPSPLGGSCRQRNRSTRLTAPSSIVVRDISLSGA